jgi:hypothetical protein
VEDLTNLFKTLRDKSYTTEPKVGVHVNWNAPMGKPQPAWEILLGILSACYWNSQNGPIDLYTDEIGMKNVENLGLTGLYRNVKLLDPEMSQGLDPKTFWAAGKFMAMLEADEPVYIIDQDLLIHKNLKDVDSDVLFLHKEVAVPEFYPEFICVDVSKYYGFPRIDYAYNCALIHFKDVDVMREYAAKSLRYMSVAQGVSAIYSANQIMCTVEQFGLQQFCGAKNLSSQSLIQSIYNPDLKGNFWEPSEDGVHDIEASGDWIFHSWAQKGHLRENFHASLEFSLKLVTMIEKKIGTSLEPLLQKLNFEEH